MKSTLIEITGYGFIAAETITAILVRPKQEMAGMKFPDRVQINFGTDSVISEFSTPEEAQAFAVAIHAKIKEVLS